SNENFQTNLFDLVDSESLNTLQKWYNHIGEEKIEKGDFPFLSSYKYAPLYRHPSKIWGIGLNYTEHASDLNEVSPNSEPASFLKPNTTIIGQDDLINIPYQSHKTTAEAELGIVIAKKCKNIDVKSVQDYIAGYTTII